jgi:hypothetical protein
MIGDWSPEVTREYLGLDALFDLPVRPLGRLRLLGFLLVAVGLFFVWTPARALGALLRPLATTAVGVAPRAMRRPISRRLLRAPRAPSSPRADARLFDVSHGQFRLVAILGAAALVLTFVAAEPAPGSTIAGCGGDAAGCSGRVRMRFRLLSATGGPVLDAIGFLHATNKIACYRGSTGPLDLQAGVPAEVLIVFDEADAVCGVPSTISNMKVVLSAPVQTDGLQEWAIRYEFTR